MLGNGKKVFVRLPAVVVFALVALGCDGGAPAAKEVEPVSRSSDKPPVVIVEAEREETPWILEELSFEGEEEGELFALGAIPAWSAVHERYRLLARRGEHGAVYGTLVNDRGTMRLVDEGVGHGALSIPILLGAGQKVVGPRRVLLEGAWVVRENEWVWKAQSIQGLPENKSQPEDRVLAFTPGLSPRWEKAPRKPKNASQIPTKGGILGFRVVSGPTRTGDGWLISDLAGGDAVARLRLPGEKPSYGDQSTLSEEERWSLTRGKRYWVEIKRYRSRPVGVYPTFSAISVPSFMGAKPTKTKDK